MMTADLLAALPAEIAGRPYFTHHEILAISASLIKARLHISDSLFIQIYRNDRFDTTNLALIYNGSRIYARDQLGGNWHRHEYEHPERHDHSRAGQTPVTLTEFLDEVETLLTKLGLP